MESSVKVKIGDQEVGFKFTMKTLELITEKKGIDFFEIVDYFTKRPFGMVNMVFLCANIVYNKGQEVSEYDIDDWIEEMSQEDLQKVWQCFEASLTKNTEKMIPSEGPKKK